MKWKINTLPKNTKEENEKLLAFLSEEEIGKVKKYHESFPQYAQTPLTELSHFAGKMGLKNMFLKDESYRFGLNAFKVLGGSYAMAKYMAEKLGKDIEDLPYNVLISDQIKKELGDITFVTATDGNHGRGVAWTANILKQKSRVFMPLGSSEIRLAAIARENAEVTVENANYDECVRMADDYAKTHENSIVVQDTAWEGYEKIPAWIMQGYGTMALEAIAQLEEKGIEKPTHIFLQAGVGSFAGAMQGVFASKYKENAPIVAIVESDLADCLYQSALLDDGSYTTVGGDMQTLMAGLACGEPNITGWEILKNHSQVFISSEDHLSANGMRILAAPVKGDERITAGESGAVTTGVVYEIMTNPDYKELKETLKLDENSIVLVFSTEGDTDPEMYEDVVWKGRNSKL